MKILLLGATGMVGSRILSEAVARKHQVVAVARNPQNIKVTDGIVALGLNVTDAQAVASAAQDVDVIVSAVSPRNSDDAVADAAAIAQGVIGGAKQANKRVLVVGGAGTLDLPDGNPVMSVLPDFIVPEATGMKNFRNDLQASDLDWSFFAPAATIEPGERTGNFRLGTDVLVSDSEGNSKISAEDFACALVNELERPAHSGQIFTIGY